MYIFIENNNTKNGEKKEIRKKELSRIRTWHFGLDATTPNHYTTEAYYVTWGKSLQFIAFSMKLPTARWSSRINRAINSEKTM